MIEEDQEMEQERIRKIVQEAQMIQAKRTIKTIIFLSIALFAIKGAMVIYHFLFS